MEIACCQVCLVAGGVRQEVGQTEGTTDLSSTYGKTFIAELKESEVVGALLTVTVNSLNMMGWEEEQVIECSSIGARLVFSKSISATCGIRVGLRSPPGPSAPRHPTP